MSKQVNVKTTKTVKVDRPVEKEEIKSKSFRAGATVHGVAVSGAKLIFGKLKIAGSAPMEFVYGMLKG